MGEAVVVDDAKEDDNDEKAADATSSKQEWTDFFSIEFRARLRYVNVVVARSRLIFLEELW